MKMVLFEGDEWACVPTTLPNAVHYREYALWPVGDSMTLPAMGEGVWHVDVIVTIADIHEKQCGE